MRYTLICALLCAALPAVAVADDWTGSGELGLAVSRGNSRSENFNTKLDFASESDDWAHTFSLAGLRARAEVSGDFDGDGIEDRRRELSANRYQLGASSAYQMNSRASWIGSLRHEDDDFSAFAYQSTFALSYGYRLIHNETTEWSAELGPGFRRAKRAEDDAVESDLILRGALEFTHALTPNATLSNTLLIESGDDNRFAQNDFGVSVAMNSRLALKAGVQLRRNSEVAQGTHKTDTLTTMNLVYTLH